MKYTANKAYDDAPEQHQTTMNLTVREMSIADYDQVIKLWSATEAMLLRDADSRESIERYLSLNPGLSFVVERLGQIVGAILVGSDGRRGYVQHLAVHQSERGAGIGKQLITCAISALETIGISKTHLFVANDNIDAQKFYESLGWFPRDEVRMYSFNASDNQNI
jgi:ribosomal protein S18 acetylase RimI-like enzyme